MKLLLSSSARRQLDALASQPGGAWLFNGPVQVGKFTAARVVAAKITKHPSDVTVVAPDGLSIGIEQVHGLNRQLQLLSASSTQPRVVIIDEADKLTHEAQNALLKLLEEPPLDTTIVLIAQERHKLLPTILSRCRSISFGVQAATNIASWLKNKYPLSMAEAERLANLCNGAVGLACQLLEDADKRAELEAVQAKAKQLFAGDVYASLQLAKELSERQQLQTVVACLLGLLRQQLREVAANRQQLIYTYKKLQAALYTQRYLEANGSPKVAFDSLSLELAV